MKQKQVLLIALLVMSVCSAGFAQQAVVASGGNATGSGGSSSYSVGQVVYTVNSGANGRITQGVQQPFEISTLGTDNLPTANINLIAFPNPTNDILLLSVENYDTNTLVYQLFDVTGKAIKNGSLNRNQTEIDMSQTASGVYLLNITKDSGKIKTFKIIKN
ncbi:T9SS type A sorting domain-containing protein [Flavobacterium sp. N1994]|uniref:T9SS type A sorting domain-containing protein n=1 Tax=Flavobacterium sp. N1994 TaxID=2986827 RepID=UPI002222F0C0|nr:T9SS type A sorting domain-containing protein [Flavobacterium sp. N1994]